MPDSASLELPGGGSGGGKGVPSWVMVVGAVAGVAGLLLLLKGGGGGGGTTAAGTSINAALGSIQEENMNLLGVTQAGFMQTNQGMTTGFLNTQNQIGGLGTQIGQGFTDTNGLIAALEHDITAQLTAFSGQTQDNYSNLSTLISSGQATQAQLGASENQLLQSIQGDVQAGLVGQQQANGMLSMISGQVAGVSSQVSGTQADVNALGRFAGWEFYQIPNRYAVYIPGQGPSNAGGNVIGTV